MYGTTGFALALGGYLGITQMLSPANERCLRPHIKLWPLGIPCLIHISHGSVSPGASYALHHHEGNSVTYCAFV